MVFFLGNRRDSGSPYWKFIKVTKEVNKKTNVLLEVIGKTTGREKFRKQKKETKKIKTITESALAIIQLKESISF